MDSAASGVPRVLLAATDPDGDDYSCRWSFRQEVQSGGFDNPIHTFIGGGNMNQSATLSSDCVFEWNTTGITEIASEHQATSLAQITFETARTFMTPSGNERLSTSSEASSFVMIVDEVLAGTLDPVENSCPNAANRYYANQGSEVIVISHASALLPNGSITFSNAFGFAPRATFSLPLLSFANGSSLSTYHGRQMPPTPQGSPFSASSSTPTRPLALTAS
jgi:hypothetical protein